MRGKGILALLAAALVLACAGCDREVSGYALHTDLGNGVVLESFTGTMEKNLPSGTGSAAMTTDGQPWSYEGTFSGGAPFVGKAEDMPAVLAVQGQQFPGTYTGEISGLEMSGAGVFTASEGDFTCQGVFDIGGLSQWQSYEVSGYPMELVMGQGTYSGVFDGQFQEGRPAGDGTFTATDGSGVRYEGVFVNGTIPDDGSAVFHGLPYALDYEGQTLQGSYDGTVAAGVPEGTGVFTYQQEDDYFEYDGPWAQGAMAGEGTLKSDLFVVHFAGGDVTGVYEGGTVDGVAAGTGTFTAENREGVSYTYQGQWSGGIWNGAGELRLDDGSIPSVGTFTEGIFTPTFQEYMAILGQVPPAFTLSEEVTAAAEGYAFAQDRSVMAAYTDEALSYESYTQAPESAGTGLMYLEGYHVTQMSQWNETLFDQASGAPFGQTITELIVADENGGNVCWVEYFGELLGLNEGDGLTVRGLPLACSSFRNVSGEEVPCVVMLGAEILYGQETE